MEIVLNSDKITMCTPNINLVVAKKIYMNTYF